jgi:hypothetical protein
MNLMIPACSTYFRNSPPRRLIPLATFINVIVHHHLEERYFANLSFSNKFPCFDVRSFTFPVLRNTPYEALVSVLGRILDKVQSGFHIWTDGFLTQNVFSCSETFEDDRGLNINREDDDDGTSK